MSSKTKTVNLDPNLVKIPTVRVTSMWDPDEYELFKASLDADGQGQAIICVKEGDTYWLADGLHRLQEAKLKGWPKILVAYKEGSLIDAKLRNLYMNRLRGKTKVSEEVFLIRSLMEEDHLSLGEIQRRTGLSKESVDMRWSIAKAIPEIQVALDQEQISVGVAFQLSRLPYAAGQLSLLMALLQHIPPMTVDAVKRVVDDSLETIAARTNAPTIEHPQIPIPTFKCWFCEQKYPEGEVVGKNICIPCAGIAKDYIQDLMKQRKQGKTEEQILAEKAASGGPKPESPP